MAFSARGIKVMKHKKSASYVMDMQLIMFYISICMICIDEVVISTVQHAQYCIRIFLKKHFKNN